MWFVPCDSFEHQLEQFEFGRLNQLVESGIVHLHYFRTNKTGCLGGLGPDALKPAHHALIVTVGLVFGRLEKRIIAQPLTNTTDLAVERQAFR